MKKFLWLVLKVIQIVMIIIKYVAYGAKLFFNAVKYGSDVVLKEIDFYLEDLKYTKVGADSDVWQN